LRQVVHAIGLRNGTLVKKACFAAVLRIIHFFKFSGWQSNGWHVEPHNPFDGKKLSTFGWLLKKGCSEKKELTTEK